MELVNRQLIAQAMTHEAPWCGSHGADGDYLGMGLIYYGIVYATRSKVAVCLGSGGGFVPRLMRQAQRDLGMTNIGRTILVDANRPEAGWGAPAWLPDASFFRTHFDDIELVFASTQDAARTVFRKENLVIDYLHIDADHSFEACLADFQAYRPYLREGSMITLHDTNYSGAGVKHVVEHLRTRGDCEVIDFTDVGVGTAIVRIVGVASQLGNGSILAKNTSIAVRAERRYGSTAMNPPSWGWAYLESPAFAMRSVLAAHFVRDCATVIELGAGKVTIDEFLQGEHASVIVLDPLIRERQCNELRGRPCCVEHVRATFQDIDWQIDRPGEYGLVMLGMELQGMSDKDYRTLYDLVDHARMTVIEFPTSWQVSRDQFASIRRRTLTREIFTCKLDLSDNELGDMSNSWPPRCDREIHVLTRE